MTAEYRSVQTRMWREDEWFQSLDTEARLLFIYLFTNPSASISGIYRLPLRTMEFESGIPARRILELMGMFSKANKAHFEDGVIWVVRMRENQLPGNVSPKVQVRLDKDVASIPYCALKIRYLKHYGYPIDTVSILDRTETDTDTIHICPADAVPTAQQNSLEPEKPARTPRKKPEPEQPVPTESGEMFTRLCFVLLGHMNTSNGGLTEKQRGMLNKEAKRLREAGATPDDLGEWYKTVWRKQWPGSNGQAPTVSQVVAGVNAWRMKKQETAADPYVVDTGDPSGAKWIFNRGAE